VAAAGVVDMAGLTALGHSRLDAVDVMMEGYG